MSDLRKAAQQALQYLDAPTAQLFKDARLALRAALAQPEWTPAPHLGRFSVDRDRALAQPEQKPVAYQWLGTSVIRKRIPKTAEADAWQPLYTAPPQRKPIRDAEIVYLWDWSATAAAERTASTQQHAFARAIEKAHGIGGEE